MEQVPSLEKLFKLFNPYTRRILLFSLLTGLLGATTLLLLHPRYRATTTLLPGNSLLQDKARIFNPNIKDLYSYFGNTDDLDRITAVAASDTILERVFLKHNLWSFYSWVGDTVPPIRKFKTDLEFHRTDKDQLQISVSLKDAAIAAAVANDIALETNKHLQSLVAKEESKIVAALQESIQTLQNEYDTTTTGEIDKATLVHTIAEQQKLLYDWKTQQQLLPNFITIVELANPTRATKLPNKPIFISLFVLGGFVIACFFVSVKTRNQKNA